MKIPIISKQPEKRSRTSDLLNPKNWLLEALGISKSKSGISVNEETAMRLSAVYACVRIISETIASLPLNVYKRLDKGKEKVRDHSLFKILHTKPNDDMTAFSYRETMLWHLLLWGNSYSLILRNRRGEVGQLYPLLPNKMKVEIKNKNVFYTYDNKPVSKDEILHIPGLSFNGVIGKSPIAYMRESIGLGLALEQFGSEVFSSGGQVSGVVEHPGTIGPKAFANLYESLNKRFSGLGKNYKLMLLEEGMEYKKTALPPEDSQFIQSRKYQLEDIARMFRVQLHLLQNLDRATFSNIEHQGIDFVVHTIRPWLVRIEQPINIKLFNDEDNGEYFAEHVVDGLLRGDMKARYEAYATSRQNGWMSANDIRELENMNPLPDEQGDVYLVPLNMVDAKNLGNMTNGRTVVIKGEEIRILPNEVEIKPEIEREERGIRSAKVRARLSKAYRGLFENVATRIIKRETADILKIAKKTIDKRNILIFNEKLDDYYNQHQKFIATHMKPIFNTFAEAISDEAAAEIGYDLKNINQRAIDSVRIEGFMEKYLKAFNIRYVGKSKTRISYVIESSIEKEKDPLEELEKEFNKWEEKKPEAVSTEETIKIAGAVSILVYKFGGITKLIWRNTGSKTCVYCQNLDGVVVGIEETFIPKGIDYNPEGSDGSMKISGPRFHPPLHDTCVCQISAA